MEDRIVHSPLIILAGGASSRMGSPKGLLPFNDRFWLEEQLHRFAFCGTKAVVVLGYDHEKYFQALPALKDALQLWVPWPSAQHENLQLSVTINSHPEKGPFSSLKRALERFLHDTDAFVLPIDVPVPVPQVWRELETSGKARRALASVPQHETTRGHPVWLSSQLVNRLKVVSPDHPDARLDRQLGSLSEDERLVVNVRDPKIGWNANTPAEYEELKRRLSKEMK